MADVRHFGNLVVPLCNIPKFFTFLYKSGVFYFSDANLNSFILLNETSLVKDTDLSVGSGFSKVQIRHIVFLGSLEPAKCNPDPVKFQPGSATLPFISLHAKNE